MAKNESLNVVVYGSGVMGSGIAQVLAVAGHSVIGFDISKDVVEVATESIDTGRYGVKSSVERGKLTKEEAEAALKRVTFTTDSNCLSNADIVIEAVPEVFDLKIRLFKEFDNTTPKDCILATNSSGYSVSALAAVTERPEKVIGWHWGSPVPVIKLSEIIRGKETSDKTVDTVVALATEAGKNPIVIADTFTHWGYVTNRVYFAMVAEANRVVEEGIATREEVDQLMMDAFRWPTGPYGMVAGAGSGWKK